MTARGLRFFRLRLGNASLPELACRAGQELTARRVRLLPPEQGMTRRMRTAAADGMAQLEMPEFHGRLDPDAVESILGGAVFTLSADPEVLARCEERLGKMFCTAVTPSRSGCDIRQLWEPARLQHVTALIASMLSGGGREGGVAAGRFAGEAVIRWIAVNPFPYGPHYASAMECGLRIPVFFYCLKSLGEWGDRERTLLLASIHRHAWWIARRLSLHSSLGNHTIAECVGLAFAGAVFRGTDEGKRWLKKAAELLEGELPHQVLADGGPAEQSLHYHRFVLDLYWLAVDFLEKNRLHDCGGMKPRLARGEDFLAAFGNGEIPSIGDSDDGHAVAPGVLPRRECSGKETGEFRVFRKSGFTVARTTSGIAMTFDHGPLGMAPLYNHGHADALAITIASDGKQLLVDPGTYRYNGEPVFRNYFKGTRAHNTVAVDGLDQAVQETGFIWSKPYTTRLTRCEKREDGMLVEAVHDGYARLSQPVLHRRTILCAREAGFIVRDSFDGSGFHDFELHFHLHPGAEAEQQDGGWRIAREGRQLFVVPQGGGDFRLLRGRENPPLGWYSPAYGTKKASGVLQSCRRGPPGEVVFLTFLSTGEAADLRRLEAMAWSL